MLYWIARILVLRIGLKQNNNLKIKTEKKNKKK